MVPRFWQVICQERAFGFEEGEKTMRKAIEKFPENLALHNHLCASMIAHVHMGGLKSAENDIRVVFLTHRVKHVCERVGKNMQFVRQHGRHKTERRLNAPVFYF